MVADKAQDKQGPTHLLPQLVTSIAEGVRETEYYRLYE